MYSPDSADPATITWRRRVFVYVLLVFGGGTLINTGHPVAVEAGKLIHTVTLVDPTIYWAHEKGLDTIAGGLRTLSDGVDVRRWT